MIRSSYPPPPVPPLAAEGGPIFEPLTVRVATAVKLTGLSRSRIYELIQSGDLPAKKIGRSTLISFADLKRFVAGAPSA